MNYDAFIMAVQKEVEQLVGQEMKVELHQVTKNNGVILKGVCIRQPGVRVVPTIYLEEFYQRYQSGEELGVLAKEILAIHEKSKKTGDFSLDCFTDFSKMQSQITLKLVNREKNRELLREVPWIPYLNLAIVFIVNIQDEELGSGNILIRLEHLKLWKVSKEVLYEYARENTLKLRPAKLQTMEEAIEDFLAPEERHMMKELPMYVLSNEERIFGAAGLLYDRILFKAGQEIGDNFYILPSSIHEVILVPEQMIQATAFLEEVVKDINENQVDPEEVLSDKIYHYDWVHHRLSIWQMEGRHGQVPVG